MVGLVAVKKGVPSELWWVGRKGLREVLQMVRQEVPRMVQREERLRSRRPVVLSSRVAWVGQHG